MKVKIRLLAPLAMCLAGAFATSGIAAGSASAACNPTAIAGQGSSLQKIAQIELWIPGSGCKVTYTASGSGKGREIWGEEEPGHKPKDGTGKNPAESGDAFVATDEPLSESQLKNGDEAAGGEFSVENKGGKGQNVVVPVEQAAVAVIVHPPAGCKITEITNEQLSKVWNLELSEWKNLKSTGCGTAKITRVVRQDSSGTTFVFKTYLKEINNETCDTKKWSFYVEPKHNTEWPEPGGACVGEKAVHAKNQGGGGEVEEVIAKEGSIGYANLADARAKYKATEKEKMYWLKVENQKSKTFVFPGTAAEEPGAVAKASNCEGTTYGKEPNVTIDDNWSPVNGAHPGSGVEKNENYPICTLTYDVALNNYEKAQVANSAEVGKATKEYLTYVVNEGQTHLEEHDYLKVEKAVKTKAKELVEKFVG